MPKRIQYTALMAYSMFGGKPKCCHMIPAHMNRSMQECEALEHTCHPETCAFYQREKDLVASLEQNKQQLRALPAQKQVEIAERYYGGILVWWDMHDDGKKRKDYDFAGV